MKKRLLSVIMYSGALLSVSLATACVKPQEDVDATYACDSGETITVHYNGRKSAMLTYQGKDTELAFLMANYQVRYGGGDFAWVTSGARVGSKGELFRQSAGVTVQPALETCRQTE